MRALTGVLLLIAVAAAAPSDSLNVLFIGNSHTYVNDLPAMVESLAAAGGRTIETDQSVVGGYSLREHLVYDETLRKIALGGWNWVVLQEQSQIPSIAYWRDSAMYPASRSLDSLIRQAGGRTMFYMTWGWKNGGVQTYQGYSSPDFRDYFEMQESVTVAYGRIADELGAPMAPVGWAWYRARRMDSLIDLWQADSCHATVKGTYLGACVFYARLFEADPTGLGYTAGLAAEDARFLQEIAWQTVNSVEEQRPSAAPGTLRTWPNPFRAGLTVSLPTRPGRVSITDASGRVVRDLGSATSLLSWDGRDQIGRMVRAGVYFVRVAGARSSPVVFLP